MNATIQPAVHLAYCGTYEQVRAIREPLQERDAVLWIAVQPETEGRWILTLGVKKSAEAELNRLLEAVGARVAVEY